MSFSAICGSPSSLGLEATLTCRKRVFTLRDPSSGQASKASWATVFLTSATSLRLCLVLHVDACEAMETFVPVDSAVN
jgi:hypothetical protein